MFFQVIFLIVSLVTLLRNFQVSSCDTSCADKPMFSPSRLTVKYGDPTSARCTVCQHCQPFQYGLETPVGMTRQQGTMILWRVNSMTEWYVSPICYYHLDESNLCCSTLPVTVYQPPDNVVLSFVNHSGPMFEGRRYTLQCLVESVAPAENLTVTFYRGQTALGQRRSNIHGEKEPVNETFTFNMTISREDDGVEYWCKAKLDLGPEGPERPPVVSSLSITSTVHSESNSKTDPITSSSGHLLLLVIVVVAGVVLLIVIISVFLFIIFKSPTFFRLRGVI